MAQKKRYRPDKDGPHRAQYERNRKRIFATQTTCAICGKPVDFSLKYPHPMSACIDHIVPIIKGGHPSDIDNLQLAHLTCNRAKEDKLLPGTVNDAVPAAVSNRVLPTSYDWTKKPPKKT